MPRKKKTDETVVSRSEMINNFAAQVADETVVHLYGEDIKIKKYVSLSDEVGIINSVVGCAFDEETGDYVPEYVEWVKNCMLIGTYTDIQIGDPTDAYRFVMDSDVIETIKQNVSQQQLTHIENMIAEKINYELNTNIRLIKSKIENIENTISDISGVTKDFEDKVDSEKMLQFINTLQTSEFMNAISNRNK